MTPKAEDNPYPDSPGAKRSRLTRNIRMITISGVVAAFCVVGFLLWMSLIEVPAQFDTGAARNIRHTAFEQVVPGSNVPGDLGLMDSNNNLDLVRHEGFTYFAFRTAPTHFASSIAKLIVLRSKDLVKWEKETVFSLGCDLREPRFLVFANKLFLYFVKCGTRMLHFEPNGIQVTERTADGWTIPEAVFNPGYVVWRARAFLDKAYMSVYNGAGLYTTGDRAGDLRLLTSDDGRNWAPISERPQIDRVGAEEGEFCFDRDGNLVSVVRLETSGSLVCTAPRDDLATWSYQYSPEKYDSSLMLEHAGQFYVIARRNIAGAFEAAKQVLPDSLHRAWRMARYSLTRKRTALYRVDVAGGRLVPLFDFPSRGDTAFAAVVPLDANRFHVMNYSSKLDGPDWPWIAGQLIGSQIYSAVLEFGRS